MLEFGESFEAAREATVEIPAPKERKRPTVPKAKYSQEDFLRFLGIDTLLEDIGEPRLGADPLVEAMASDILRGTADWLFPKGEQA